MEVIIFVLLIPIVGFIIWIQMRNKRLEGNISKIVENGFNITDKIGAPGVNILFDTENKNIALVSSSFSTVIPYERVRKWYFDPRLNASNSQVIGYSFKVTTSDPSCPLFFVNTGLTSKLLMETWIAKFDAHING